MNDSANSIRTIADDGFIGFAQSILDFGYMVGMLVLSWLLIRWVGGNMQGWQFNLFGWLKKIKTRYLAAIAGIVWWMFLTGVLRDGVALTEQIFITFWFTIAFHKMLLELFLQKLGIERKTERKIKK